MSGARKELRGIVADLERQGYDVQGGGDRHVKVYRGNQLVTVMSASPSDRRAIRAVRMQLRHAGIELGTRPVRDNGKEADMKDERLKATPERVARIAGVLHEMLETEGPAREMLVASARERQMNATSPVPEFIRIAREEISPKYGMRSWKSQKSGENTVHFLLAGKTKGMLSWTADILEATCGRVADAARIWAAAESETPEVEPERPAVTKLELAAEAALAAEQALIVGESGREPFVEQNGHDSERALYFDTLIEVLRRDGWKVEERILLRLDAMSGVST